MDTSPLRGRRIHFAGSAAANADERLVAYAHSVIQALTRHLVSEGATFAIPFGREPRLNSGADAPSIIFDWSVAEVIGALLQDGVVSAAGPNGRLIATVSTSRTDEHIPDVRRPLYNDLRSRDAVEMRFLTPGWTAGALQRQAMAQVGDILIAISGGQGVEQLATEYSARGKPVIPLDLQLGASSGDGSGGAARLFSRALEDHKLFFRLKDDAAATDLLDRTRTRNGDSEPDVVVAALLDVLHALTPPRAFYVRMLNPKLPDYPAVEKFFRGSVDVLVRSLGYEPLEMGKGDNEFAWLNEAIFHSLHHSSVVVVDVTGLRPNCFVELGYALGNGQRVILTAMDGTNFPFDVFAIDHFPWKEGEEISAQLDRFRTHWERNIDMPKLVRPNEAR